MVMVCHLPSDHWATIIVDMTAGFVMIYDPLERIFEEKHYEERKETLIPLVRIFPQILKYTGFYDHRKELQPMFRQWKYYYPRETNPYQQDDNTNCGPIALKYVEFLMTHNKEEPFKRAEIGTYRAHIARTIYQFSTDEDTIE